MKYTPRNRAQWRKWLEKNHATETEVWLVFLKKHTPKPNLSYNDAVEEAVCFAWIDGIKKSIDENRYMHRFTPRKPNSNWSEPNKKRVERMRKAGKMAPAGEKAVEDARSRGNWDNPVSALTDFPMPPEFESRLKRNKKAAAFFDSLAPSYRREFVAWVATAKRPETRKRRLDETIKLLRQGKKLGMR